MYIGISLDWKKFVLSLAFWCLAMLISCLDTGASGVSSQDVQEIILSLDNKSTGMDNMLNSS
jgi:hypothetical protein